MNAQKCPICGAGSLKKTVKTEVFNYKGQTKEISDYVTYECPACGEAIVDNETLKTSGKILKGFQHEVDGLLTGVQIKAIRGKLRLSQEQLANIVGGGKKSVARYESGMVSQSRGMDNLLRILDAYPQTLSVILRNNQKTLYKMKVPSLEEYKLTIVGSKKTDGKYNADDEEMIYGS